MSPEEDADFFPAAKFDEVSHFLSPGQLIITESGLSSLEDKLIHIHLRAKIYGEYSLTKLDFLEMIEDLQARVSTIRRTAHE